MTTTIKNHAELKRVLKEGVSLETLALATGVAQGRARVGVIRVITKADTTGVYLQTEGIEGRGSFLGFDKASNWTFAGDVITHSAGMSYKVLGGDA